jgi:hypothetical protein
VARSDDQCRRFASAVALGDVCVRPVTVEFRDGSSLLYVHLGPQAYVAVTIEEGQPGVAILESLGGFSVFVGPVRLGLQDLSDQTHVGTPLSTEVLFGGELTFVEI